MRRSPLLLAAVLALGLAACSGEAEVDLDASPEVTATETVTDEATTTETETVVSPTPVPTSTNGADDAPRATTSPTGGEDDVAQLAFTDCEAEQYTAGYPEDWNVNDPDGSASACTIFHPGEVETPDEPRDRDLHWAVTVYVDAVEYEDVRDGAGRNEELSSEELTVDGRDAVVREYRSSGDALVPEGERWYSYTVDLDGEILVAVTYSVGDTDYDRDRAILDRMVTEELAITG